MTQALRASSIATATIIMTAVLSPSGLYAQGDDRSELLVSAEWLAQHLNDPNLVLLHVGDSADYAAEHIPGARYTSHRELSDTSSGPDALVLELPEPDRLQTKLRELGISNDSRIVVYWGSEWVSPTARVVFTLAWAGLSEQTVLLDGGIDAWKAAGHAVTAEPAPATEGDIVIEPQAHLVVDADWVQSHSNDPGYRLIDGRSAEFYDGSREDRGIAGHIPGAGNIVWQDLLDDSLKLKNAATLRDAFAAAGVESDDTVVAYCHIGQYATMVMFMARTLGHEVKLYDGAFQDWAGKGLPVERRD
jgi:thiosulfate/3-mercaptopyruvate sulfurtransferase